MKIQLISSLLSTQVLEGIRSRTGQYPAYAVQKFYRVLAEGFVKNGVSVEVVSNPPAFASTDKFVKFVSDTENGEIKVFDTKTNQLMKAIHVGKEPTTIVCL